MSSDALQDPFSSPQPAALSPPSTSLLAPTKPSHRPTLTTLLSTTDLEAATDSALDLPSAPPLSHEVLSRDDFDPDHFLLERRHTPLEDLRSELRTYLATLRTSLVGVINEEYEAFIGLSLGLKHAAVSQSLSTIRRPVLSIRGEVVRVKDELEGMRDEMAAVLDERKEVREMKALMRRLLATEEAVDKVEGLLKVGKGAEKARQLELTVDSPAKRLERIASDYTHMRYLVARAGDLPYVHSLEPRITQLTSTLHQELADLLSSILAGDPSSPTYRKELITALRTFSSLNLVPQAEDIIRTSVLDPFIKRAVHRDALSDSSPGAFPTAEDAYVPPAYRLEPIDPPAAHRDASPDALPLLHLFNRLLAFVSRDCSVLLDVAERVVVGIPPSFSLAVEGKSRSAPSTESSALPAGPGGYEVLSNVVFFALVTALVTELGPTLFAAGRPTVFHQNYLLASAFVARIESLTPSIAHLEALRASPTYVALFKRFQLPVYFQLRLKDAVSSIERAFDVGSASGGGGGGDGFVMSESEAVYKALRRCWEEEVWLEELTARFWRLSLQILSRYRTWLNDQVPKYVLPASASSANLAGLAAPASGAQSRSSFDGDRSRLTPSASASSTRPSTPSGQPQSDEASEETTLRQLTVLIADARTMERKVWSEIWEEGGVKEKVGAADEGAADVLRASLSSMTSLVPSLSSQITTILIKRCAEHLKLVRSVASQVRASTRRPGQGAAEPSYFVPSILKELRAYLAGPGRVVEKDLREKWATAVVEDIAARYTAILSTQKKTEDSLRWLKKGRQGLSFFGRAASSTPQPDESDDDRVKQQMQVDVEALARDAEELGVDVGGSGAFEGLRRATRGEAAEGKEEGNASAGADPLGGPPQPSTALAVPPSPISSVPVHIPQDPNGVLDRALSSSASWAPPLRHLLSQPALAVVRELEMLNVFLGFEQANKYRLLAPNGALLGYLLEEETSFVGTMSRQLLRNHRPFKATVIDPEGQVLLKVHRPFALINSRIFVSTPSGTEPTTASEAKEELKRIEATAPPPSASTSLTPAQQETAVAAAQGEQDTGEVIGEVQQEWHVWRRRYNLFRKVGEGDFEQFARFDGGFLAWDFEAKDEEGRVVGSVSRNFSGFARELFTDTGHYVLRFDAASVDLDALPPPSADALPPPSSSLSSSTSSASSSSPSYPSNPALSPSSSTSLTTPESATSLPLDARAVLLASATTIDIDFFSRHSGGGGMFGGAFMPIPIPMGGAGAGGAAGEAGGVAAGEEAAGQTIGTGNAYEGPLPPTESGPSDGEYGAGGLRTRAEGVPTGEDGIVPGGGPGQDWGFGEGGGAVEDELMQDPWASEDANEAGGTWSWGDLFPDGDE
ncbi:hypothetical protein JCM8097_001962 [Rhodosporidiobolus ruineniae]